MEPEDSVDAASPLYSDEGDILRNGSTSPIEDEKGMYSCDKCKYKAKQRSNLMRHYYTMHADLTDQLECCGQLYSTKGDFRQHVKTVHKQGYLCKICNRTFSRKALLKRHSYVHNGIREFKCEHCNYATSHKSNLERHFKVHTPLLRKRRCRLSYRITNGYPKHLALDGGQLSDHHHHPSMDDRGHPLGPLSSIPGCPRYGPLPRSAAHPWNKYPFPVDEASLARSHFPVVRTPLEEYENLIKLQLMKQSEPPRRTSFPPSEDVFRHLSHPPHKPTPILGHHLTPPPPRLKDSLVGRVCDSNCFCKSNSMWMLPVYQGFLSSQEVYAQLNSGRGLSRLHTRLTSPQTIGLHDSRTSATHPPPMDAAAARYIEQSERNVYLQLLKQQQNNISAAAVEKTRLADRICEEELRAGRVDEGREERRPENLSSDEREISSIKENSKFHVPRSDQPLKKRYKRFFIENIK